MQLSSFDDKPDEIAQFRQPRIRLRDLLIDPKNPSEIPAVRGSVESFGCRSIPLKLLGATYILFTDEVVTLHGERAVL